MTCRAVKPRGRKPKTSGNVKKMQLSSKRAEESGPKKKVVKAKPTKTTAAEQDSCLICGELFADSRAAEQWIQCQKCCGWCHEECIDDETSRGFVCDFCRP
jgi:hypothetical protein